MKGFEVRDEAHNDAYFQVRFPKDERNLAQDEEWCVVKTGSEEERIRFHDYDKIFSIPGLYEHLFYDTLGCCSPEVVCDLLEETLGMREDLPAVGDLRVLDVGAGNGMVGEELQKRGVEEVIGLDLIPEAAIATERDRAGVYTDYLVEDLTDLSARSRERLQSGELNCMTSVAALGFGDIPPEAFREAFNFIDDSGWIAFNIRDKFLDTEESSEFSRLIERMVDQGVLADVQKRKYRHRLSMNGRPIYYYALVASKTASIPRAWVAPAQIAVC